MVSWLGESVRSIHIGYIRQRVLCAKFPGKVDLVAHGREVFNREQNCNAGFFWEIMQDDN